MRFSKAVFVAVAILCSSFSPADKFPPGVYMSFSEIQDRSPSKKCKLLVETRSKKAKIWVGGSDFKLTPVDRCISKYALTNDVWGYADDSAMYVNAKMMMLQDFGYAKVLTTGRFLCFSNRETTSDASGAIMFGGMVGGLIGAGIAAAMAGDGKGTENVLYVIDTDVGKLFWVDSAYMVKTLQEYSAIGELFKKENMNDPGTQLRYLQMANEASNSTKK